MSAISLRILPRGCVYHSTHPYLLFFCVETLERERQLNAALEHDVLNIEEKQEHEKKLDNLKLKRPWVVSFCVPILFCVPR